MRQVTSTQRAGRDGGFIDPPSTSRHMSYLNVRVTKQSSSLPHHTMPCSKFLKSSEMENPVFVVCFLVVILHCSSTCEALEVPKDEILDLYNELRRSENASDMVQLKWDNHLAELAKSWAEKCDYSHGGLESEVYNDIGQNLYVTSSPTLNYTAAINGWYSEKKNYNYATQSCKAACGHYLQIVWAFSEIVGCGAANCSAIHGTNIEKGFLFVCDFAPAGNWGGMDPYTKGVPCSGCFGECDEGLCVSDYP